MSDNLNPTCEESAREPAASLRVNVPRSQPGCDCSICDENYMSESDSRDSVGQSADLRTRITQAMYDQF